MNIELAAVKKQLDAVQRELGIVRKLVQNQVKPDEHWVSGKTIGEITEWNSEDLRRARRQNLIDHKRDENNNWKYLLESIPPIFIKAKP